MRLRDGEQRYSPAEVVEAIPAVISGSLDLKKICTSYVERQNLTMWMQIRRLTRAHKCVQQKAGQPQGRYRAALRVVQLLPDSWLCENHACDGSRDHGSRVER
jgi:hypothetical protein